MPKSHFIEILNFEGLAKRPQIESIIPKIRTTKYSKKQLREI
jgi:hypothetical protein